MVVGYVLLGGIGGGIAATLHLVREDGTLLAAIGIFYVACALTMVVGALWVALRAALCERHRVALALSAPVPALVNPRRAARRAATRRL
ncbi:MAG: hypothetical protein AAGG09_11630 [Pseudomonadota bacterium]